MPRRRPGTSSRLKTGSSASSSSYESDADDEASMSPHDYPNARPLTVAIPAACVAGPYCPRRPTLADILANTAAPPWTLAAFMAFLSHNHCLETLEFTMDASRYRKHYAKMQARQPAQPDECAYVQMLWQRLLDAYIAPNGPREVNLPADVRDSLLSQPSEFAPHPSALDPAVAKIYELMEESVLTPFLNSLGPTPPQPSAGFEPDGLPRSYDERSYASRGNSPTTQRASAPSSLTSTFMHSHARAHSRFSSSTPVALDHSGSDALTDDSGSASSPSGLDDPMTPPTTPPMTDFGYGYYDAPTGYAPGSTPSPRQQRGDHSGLAGATKDGWKRVSSKLWPKKRSGGALREDEAGAGVEGGLF